MGAAPDLYPQDLSMTSAHNPRRPSAHTPAAVSLHDQPVEDAEFEEVEGDPSLPSTLLRADDRGAMRAPEQPTLIHAPMLRQRAAQVFEITGKMEDSRIIPWGFWGGLLAVVAIVGLIVLRGPSGLYDTTEWLVALGLASVGGAMFKWGPRDNLRRHTLLTVDLARAELRWPVHMHGDPDNVSETEVSLALEDVQEIVFGMIYAPLSARTPDAHIHAFTLLVRNGHGHLVPVIEACPDKGHLYELTQLLAGWTGAPVTQVGEGVRE